MKRFSLITFAIFSSLAMIAQKKFTLNVYVDEALNDSCYNIYLSDDFFHLSDDVAECLHVVDKKCTYNVDTEKPLAGRLRCVYSDGGLAEDWIDFVIVPEGVLNLLVRNGTYISWHDDAYKRMVEQMIPESREQNKWKSPHTPKLSGMKYKNVLNIQKSCIWSVKEIVSNKKECVACIVCNRYLDNAIVNKDAYLKDEIGNKYKLLRALMGDIGENNSLEARVYGGYYAFEPIPESVNSMTFHNGNEIPLSFFLKKPKGNNPYIEVNDAVYTVDKKIRLGYSKKKIAKRLLLDADSIESIEAFEPESAIKKWYSDGINGVLKITIRE